jgi:replicative DNA helicase
MSINRFYNEEAEVMVLGSVMKENNSLCKVIDILKAADFYNPRHQIIYNTMVKMYENSQVIEIFTLAEHLGVKLGEVGGVTYLTEIYSSCVSALSIEAYGDIIKEKANRRRLFEAMKEAMYELKEKDTESSNLIDSVTEKLMSLKTVKEKEDGSLQRPMKEFITKLEERWRNGGDIQGVKCGYKNLDKILGGFMPQDFIILAARPSMGKTAVALNLALNCTLLGKAKVAFFNLEMGNMQILQRALSSLAEIPMENLKCGRLDDSMWVKTASCSNELLSSNLKIFDKVHTLRGIKEQCKRLKIQGGLDVVFIDYLQLISSEEKNENRTQDISKISRSLKLMAKELEITVVSLAQLSRAPEMRADHKPLLSDLRESGAIEQDADIVMFLYRDEYYKADSDRPNTIDCIIAKNRNGQVGTVRLRWIGECQKVS